jgi:hypothetical protein
MQERTRPGRLQRLAVNGHGEPVWEVELVNRESGVPERTLVVGVDTGSIYGCHSPVAAPVHVR